MTEGLTRIVDEIVRAKLTPYGLDHVDIREDVDHDNEPALFIDAVLKPNSQLIEADIYNGAHRALRDALVKFGEHRFPYFFIRHPDEERAEP